MNCATKEFHRMKPLVQRFGIELGTDKVQIDLSIRVSVSTRVSQEK